METDFITSSIISLSINLIYTLVALLLAIGFILLTDKILLKNIELQVEIKKGNLAAAVFASSMVLFIAIIISSGLR